MNVVNLNELGPIRGRGRGKKFRGRDIIWTRDKPIISVQPKYNLDSLSSVLGQTKNSRSGTDASGELKTPLGGPIGRRTPGVSSVRGKSSSSVPTETGKSSSSCETNSYVIVAITSGRGDASCEIGMAAMDLQYPHLIISQISDTQTFTNTLANINLFHPIEIVMPETMCVPDELSCNLFSTIQAKYKNVLITAISRQHFNKSEGMDRVKTLVSPAYSSVEIVVKEKYYALAATAALFKYIEHIQHIAHAPNSMKVEFQCSENKMLIDVDSAQNLELVSGLTSFPKSFSLYGALNRCQTRTGKCQLRASILQPSCDETYIHQRQECITELLSNRQLQTLIIPTLRRLGKIDKLLHGLCVKTLSNANDDNVKIAERKLNYILTLKNTLETVPELHKLLETLKTDLFKKMYQNSEDERFELMLNQILDVVHKDAQCVVGYSSANMQRCFAIKSGISDMLDVARQTYCELIDNMSKEVERYGIEHKLDLSMACNTLYGYHIQMPVPKRITFNVSDLPELFINVEKKRNTIYMTTPWLLVMSLRCRDFTEELHVISAALLEKLTDSLRESIVCLYQLGADIAELDQIISLTRISAIPEFVIPSFGEKMEVKNSRHPVRYILGNEDMVANDIDASAAYNLAIITGPNMSGKTTYLKQIVLLQIMAQIGCRVPATSAQFRISDRIFSRITPRDSLECSSSTFVMEIKEIQHIFKSLTQSSLIILDEICNSTAVNEGTSLAWAICSMLAAKPAFTFVSSHFLYLTQISSVYVNIRNFHLECALVEDSDGTLEFKHKLKPGVTPISNYGIAVLKMSAFPVKIVQRSEVLVNQLSKEIKRVAVRDDSKPESDEQICYKYYTQFLILKEKKTFGFADVHYLIDEICNDPKLRDLTPIEVPRRPEVTKPAVEARSQISDIPSKIQHSSVAKCTQEKIRMSNLTTQGDEYRTLSRKESTKLIPAIKETTIDKLFKSVKCSTIKKESSCVVQDEKLAPPVTEQSGQKADELNESIEEILSPQYDYLSISPMSRVSVPKSMCKWKNTPKPQQDKRNDSSPFVIDQQSILSLSRREKLDLIKASMNKNKLPDSSSPQSPKTPSQKTNRMFDQTSILKNFSRPATSNFSKMSFFAEESPPTPKFNAVSTPSTYFSSRSFSQDISLKNYESDVALDRTKLETSSQASTVDIDTVVPAKSTNLRFPDEWFEGKSHSNLNQNLSQGENLKSISSLSEQKVEFRRPSRSTQYRKENHRETQISMPSTSYYDQLLKSLSSSTLPSTSQKKKESLALSENIFRQPVEKKRKIERSESSNVDIRLMSSSAIKEADIFRKIEGNNFDENMFYEKVQDQEYHFIDEDQLSFCQCSYTSSQSSSNR